MEKEFDISYEWRVLRNLVTNYYNKIKNDISFVIYKDIKRTYGGTYSEKQITSIQQGKTSNFLSVIYKSIYKRFFDLTDQDEFYKVEKWQNKLSCEDLTRLILLLEKSRLIVEEDRGDYTYIEKKISKISDIDFLSRKIVQNNRGFEKSKSFKKEEIKNSVNAKIIFEKYLKIVYDKFSEDRLFFQKQMETYQSDIEKFIDFYDIYFKENIKKDIFTNDFEKTEKKNPTEEKPEKLEENIKEKNIEEKNLKKEELEDKQIKERQEQADELGQYLLF